MCEPLYYSTDAFLGVVPYMYLSPLDRAKHWTGRGLVFGWMFVLPFILHGPIKGLFFSFVPYLLLGCIFFVFSQVSHLNAGCFEGSPAADGRTGGKPEWAAHQVLSACDYSTASKFWGFLSIGLNNQIVHHLFPAVDPCHYPDLAPIVAATCEEFGVRYTSYRNWLEVWTQFMDWVACLNAVEPASPPAAAAAAVVN
jgi:fatty acid desaturase